MSYNGIGLSTARGSGTNGYIQRNLSTVRRAKDRVDYKTDEQVRELDSRFDINFLCLKVYSLFLMFNE